jgi:hypothetical protein
MKTLRVAVVLTMVFGTAAALFTHASPQAASRSVSAGRYGITHLDGVRALLLDTATGAVWQYAFANYCLSRTPPGDIRQISLGETCKDGEDSFENVPSFERVSVEGLYRTATQEMIDFNFREQVKRRRLAVKPK